MSNKISISDICCSHRETLTGRDQLSFFGFPILLAILAHILEINLASDTLSLLVSFGSIFTALLLSLLVLIFDQESKLDEKKELFDKDQKLVPLYNVRKDLLFQLYSNISFSIICALILVIACLFYSQLLSYKELRSASNILVSDYFFNPIIIILLGLTTLNILMILKRIHTLLTVKPETTEQKTEPSKKEYVERDL